MLPLTVARSLRAACVVALLLGAAACGSDDDAEAESTTTTAAPEGDDGGATAEGDEIVAADFSLTDLTVAPGAEIVLANEGSAPHTATADDGSFDSGQVAGGETSDPITAPEQPGAYPFHCEIHGSMTATLTVEG